MFVQEKFMDWIKAYISPSDYLSKREVPALAGRQAYQLYRWPKERSYEWQNNPISGP
jgi:hypothetical protein